MFKTRLRNMFELENVIRKSLEEMFPEGFKMPFYANDTNLGTGHTFKYHATSPFNVIWPDVLRKLKSLGMTNWKMSARFYYGMDEDGNKIKIPAKWIGIRSARLKK
jgi:hypothetical protein